MKTIRFNLILILIFSSINLLAAKKKSGFIKFSGTVINLKGSNVTYNQLIVGYNINDDFNAANTTHQYIKLDTLGNFKFTLPNLNKPYKIYLTMNTLDGSKKLIDMNCFTEPNDSVNMKVILLNSPSKDSISFSGAGSEKYNLVVLLEKQFWKEYYPELDKIGPHNFTNEDDLDEKMQNLAKLLDRYKNLKSKILNNANINPEMKAILNYEYGRYNQEWDWRVEYIYETKTRFRTQLSTIYYKHSENFYEPPTKISVYCKYYIQSLLARTALELMFQDNSSKVRIDQYYNVIKNKFTGPVQERLIAESLTNKHIHSYYATYSSSELNALLKDAIKNIRNSKLTDVITSTMSKLERTYHNKVIDAEFVNKKGVKFKLSSLKGKVILIDTWFLGCAFCAELQGAFNKEVYPFVDNSNFIVLSVNIDRNLDNWKKGLESGIYTSEDHINLNTGGVGLEHPFLKYYDVKGSPWLLLIDSEGVIQYIQDKSSPQVWLTEIKNALARIKS